VLASDDTIMTDRQHVVLCERHAALAGLLREFLSEAGFSLTVCACLAEIEAVLDHDPSAVVVTDRWGDGRPSRGQADLQELRQLAARTGVVLTTAWISPAHLPALDMLGLGEALRVIAKPYTLDELLAAIQSVMAAHWRRRR
jgi:DNA-binding response OmpR family regulator